MKSLYNCQEIAVLLEVSQGTVYNHIKKAGINQIKIDNHTRLYDDKQIIEINDSINKREITRYYPMKTTETFYVFQSKMNQ